MMMAHDSTPDRAHLSPTTVAMLESALQKYLAESNEDDTLRAALRSIAVEAREREMRAEQLLMALKDIWYGLPQIQAVAGSDKQNRLLQRVVTLSIREYYSG